MSATTIDWDFCLYIKRDRTNGVWSLMPLSNTNGAIFPKAGLNVTFPDQLSLLEEIQDLISREFGDES